MRSHDQAGAVLLFFVGWLVYGLLASGPALWLVAGVLLLLLIRKEGWKSGLKVGLGGLFFTLAYLLINWFFAPRGATVLFTIPEGPWGSERALTLEGLGAAAEEALRLVALLLLSWLTHRLLPAESLGSWLAGWFPRVGLLVLLAFSAVPRLRRDAERLFWIWKTRGQQSSATRALPAWRQTVFWQALLGLTLESSQDTAVALHARGFGVGRPSRARSQEWRVSDYFQAASGWLAVAILFLSTLGSLGAWWSSSLAGLLLLMGVGCPNWKKPALLPGR